MQSIHPEIEQQLHTLGKGVSCCIAYSGGVDSHALLHAVVNLAASMSIKRVRAVHINHQLQTDASRWEAHCQTVCDQLGVALVIRKVRVDTAPRTSLEMQAREARYAEFASLIEEGEYLLTAQHQDDQAETVLLQLLRGAGVTGLSGMPQQRSLGAGILFRPCLALSRAELLAYAHANQLEWVEDRSNNDTNFYRNFLRHEVMPVLRKKWPACNRTLSRSAQHCATSNQLLQQICQEDYQRLRKAKGALHIDDLLGLPPLRRHPVLRHWLKVQYNFCPSTQSLLEIDKLLQASHHACACVSLRDVDIRRHQGYLYAVDVVRPHDVTQIIHWDLREDCHLPGNLGVLSLSKLRSLIPNCDELSPLQVRFRQGGERLRLPGRHFSHSLKKLFNEWGVPHWERSRVPLLYSQGEIIMVWDYTRYLA